MDRNAHGHDMFARMDVKPMMAVESKPFDADGYLYEIKWDGIRCLAYVADDSTVLKSRSNRDITREYPEFANMHEWVVDKPAILDGEIVALEEGKPSFHRWQKRKRPGFTRNVNDMIYVAFDIIYSRGRDLTSLPIETRRNVLEETVNDRPEIIVSKIYEGSGTELLKAAAEKGLEGIMAKKAGSVYMPAKRTSDWLKFKNITVEDFIICGNLRGESSEVGSIVLGAYDKRGLLSFQGIVGSGLTESDRAYLKEYAVRYPAKCPFMITGTVTGADTVSDTGKKPICLMKETRKAVWMRPTLVCSVQFLERVGGGLRHPSFKGFRFDKSPEECIAAEVH